ncbi:hypothetical protein MKX03_004461 [Papaver bracteatum]|nr:hypothetical protein MKX03_004461 [Papaver bracteatum]
MVDNSQADIVTHRHGVVCRHFMILSERLHGATAQFDQLGAIRFQEAVNRATPRRKPQKVSISHLTDAPRSVRAEVRKPHEFLPEPLRVQQQLLDDETRAPQAQHIEFLSEQLAQAIYRNRSSKTFLLLFFFVLTFSVVFLD